MKIKYWMLSVAISCVFATSSYPACNAPPGKFCYEVGRLKRPLFTNIINHHDVLVRHSNSNGTLSENRFGFFADDFALALAGFYLYSGPGMYNPFVGWVDGHTGDEGDWGSETMEFVDASQYVLVKSRFVAANYPLGYHVVLFNCQHWASQTLR